VGAIEHGTFWNRSQNGRKIRKNRFLKQLSYGTIFKGLCKLHINNKPEMSSVRHFVFSRSANNLRSLLG